MTPKGRYQLDERPAERVYDEWDAPDMMVSDGAYGVAGFPGDPREPEGLPAWYAPHIARWAEQARPSTTLWFWNTEKGWRTLHPALEDTGWE